MSEGESCRLSSEECFTGSLKRAALNPGLLCLPQSCSLKQPPAQQQIGADPLQKVVVMVCWTREEGSAQHFVSKAFKEGSRWYLQLLFFVVWINQSQPSFLTECCCELPFLEPLEGMKGVWFLCSPLEVV